MNHLKGKKGFTLIELMIVIAIIGILAVTLVPSLTGAQARARDTGRIQNIASTRAVLETYFGDEGEFPPVESGVTGSCLSKADGTLADGKLAVLFSKEKAPVDPQKGNISTPCGEKGVIGYLPLTKNGSTDPASYLIVTNVEINKKANTYLADVSKGDHADYKDVVGAGLDSVSGTINDTLTVYAELY